MKKTLKIITIILLIIIGAVTWNNYSEKKLEYEITKIEPNEYRQNMYKTQEINTSELKKAISGEYPDKYFIYIGRPTCVYCRKLSPIIEEISQSHTVYYFNTDKNDTTDELKNIVNNQLKINSVPYITAVKNHKLQQGISDSNTTKNEILDLIK